jgi:hypothetical protein
MHPIRRSCTEPARFYEGLKLPGGFYFSSSIELMILLARP